MKFFKLIFNRSNIIFLSALLAGFAIPKAAGWSLYLILPALMIVMTVTPLKIPPGFFHRLRPFVFPLFRGNLLSYILLGNLLIFAGLILLIQDELFWFGLVLVAAVPPAVSILSLAKTLQADTGTTYAGFAGVHLGALLVIPILGLAFLKYSALDYRIVAVTVIAWVVIPLVLSRLAVEKGWDKKIKAREGIIIDVCFFIVFYTITARTGDAIRNWTDDMTKIVLIAVLSIFLIFFIFRQIARLANIAEGKVCAWLLLATMKNYGLAGGLALLVFSPESAFAPLAFAVVNFIFTNWLKYKKVFHGKSILLSGTPPS